MEPRLVLKHEGRESTSILRGESFRVGSGPGNAVVLRGPAIGREHLEFKRAGDLWKVIDLESASGTKVNGRFVNQHSLLHGDEIEIGTARMVYLSEGQAPAAPAPIPAAAPAAPAVPIPAVAPIPEAAPAAPAPVAPAYRPRPQAPSRPPGTARPRPARFRAKGGLEMPILWGLIALFGIGAVAAMTGGIGKRTTANEKLAARMKGLNGNRRFEEVLALEGEADRSETQYLRLVDDELELARNSLMADRMGVLEKESEKFLMWQIQKWNQDNRHDSRGLIERYDQYLERFPGTANWHGIAEKRLRLAGAPSPIYLRLLKERAHETLPGAMPALTEDGRLPFGTLLRVAGDEADGHVEKERFADALAVYDRFLEASVDTMPAAESEPFRNEVKKRMGRIEKKAFAAFEKLEQEAFVLMETGKLDEADRMYKEAARTYGIDEILARCKVEIDRIREMRR